jgi:hypothetical protein
LVFPQVLHKEQFHRGAAAFPSKNTGRQDFGIVQNQQVVGQEVIGDIGEFTMLNVPGVPVENQ